MGDSCTCFDQLPFENYPLGHFYVTGTRWKRDSLTSCLFAFFYNTAGTTGTSMYWSDCRTILIYNTTSPTHSCAETTSKCILLNLTLMLLSAVRTKIVVSGCFERYIRVRHLYSSRSKISAWPVQPSADKESAIIIPSIFVQQIFFPFLSCTLTECFVFNER